MAKLTDILKTETLDAILPYIKYAGINPAGGLDLVTKLYSPVKLERKPRQKKTKRGRRGRKS